MLKENFSIQVLQVGLGSPWSQQFFLDAVSSPSFPKTSLLPGIWLILHLLVTAPRTRIPYVRDLLVSCCANFLWKLLLVAWQAEHQGPPSIHLGSHILTYCYGVQLIKKKKSAFCCYLNIQIIRSDWLESWLQMPYGRQILWTQMLICVFPTIGTNLSKR